MSSQTIKIRFPSLRRLSFPIARRNRRNSAYLAQARFPSLQTSSKTLPHHDRNRENPPSPFPATNVSVPFFVFHILPARQCWDYNITPSLENARLAFPNRPTNKARNSCATAIGFLFRSIAFVLSSVDQNSVSYQHYTPIRAACQSFPSNRADIFPQNRPNALTYREK